MGITALIIAGFVIILLMVRLAIRSVRHRQPPERISPRFSSTNAIEDLGPFITRPESQEPWPFYAKRLLSQPEQVLYHRLCSALPECLVLAQVHLPRLLGVKRGHNYV